MSDKSTPKLPKRTINRALCDELIKLLADYSEKDIQRTANAMGLKGIQLTNLGGFDYIGYNETIASPSASLLKILLFQRDQRVAVYRKASAFNVDYKLSSDLAYVRGVEIDWGVFRGRFNRV
jgi:hypothetical protein